MRGRGSRSHDDRPSLLGRRAPPVTVSGGTQRFKLGSKLIKGQEFGGVAEEWVVLEPAWRAVMLAARLNQAQGGQRAFARSPMDFLHKKLREWVNSPAGQRLGLAPIPAGPVNGRMLRRTLALSLAHRPGGLLAAKIHLKHVSVVTTEGYAKARELHQTGEKSQVAS
ncbi:hypothetical protein AB0E78_41565 [Streptomyces sp. NPDC032198]|uniref:hypothetical protein n=1 Tax=Streptomyces sp. NPDC032198 TaxID=3155127 RepID=UPI0033C46103